MGLGRAALKAEAAAPDQAGVRRSGVPRDPDFPVLRDGRTSRGCQASLDTGVGIAGLRGRPSGSFWQQGHSLSQKGKEDSGLLAPNFLGWHSGAASLFSFSRKTWGWAPDQWPQTVNLA